MHVGGELNELSPKWFGDPLGVLPVLSRSRAGVASGAAVATA